MRPICSDPALFNDPARNDKYYAIYQFDRLRTKLAMFHFAQNIKQLATDNMSKVLELFKQPHRDFPAYIEIITSLKKTDETGLITKNHYFPMHNS